MAKSKPNRLNPDEVLTTAGLIKLLQELDPTGEARIAIRGSMGGTLRLPDEVTLEEVYTHKRDAGFAILERYKDESWARGGLNKSPHKAVFID